MFDRRRLIVAIGGTVASVVGRPLLGKEPVNVVHCKKKCKPGDGLPCEAKAEPKPADLNYEPWPKKYQVEAAFGVIKGNFLVGLIETASTKAAAEAFMNDPDMKNLWRECYYKSLTDLIDNENHFDKTTDSGRQDWATLNHHAYILGQLTGSLRGKSELSPRSFLRAKSKFAEAISKERCGCFIKAGAYRLPNEGQYRIMELDKDCCLC